MNRFQKRQTEIVFWGVYFMVGLFMFVGGHVISLILWTAWMYFYKKSGYVKDIAYLNKKRRWGNACKGAGR